MFHQELNMAANQVAGGTCVPSSINLVSRASVSATSMATAGKVIKVLKKTKNGNVANVSELQDGVVAAARVMGCRHLLTANGCIPMGEMVGDAECEQQRGALRNRVKNRYGTVVESNVGVKIENTGAQVEDLLDAADAVEAKTAASVTEFDSVPHGNLGDRSTDGAMDANVIQSDVTELLECMFVANDARVSDDCMSKNMHGRKVGVFADGQMFVSNDIFMNSGLVKTFGGNADAAILAFGKKVGRVYHRVMCGTQKGFAPVEDEKKSQLRQLFAVSFLEKSLEVLGGSMWRHIAIGDCFGLMSFIKERFGQDMREAKLSLFYARFLSLANMGNIIDFDLWYAHILEVNEMGVVVGEEPSESFYRHILTKSVLSSKNTSLITAWQQSRHAETTRERALRKTGVEVVRTLDGFMTAVREQYVILCDTARTHNNVPEHNKQVLLAGKKTAGACVYFNLEQGCNKLDSVCRFRHIKVFGKELENLKKMVFTRTPATTSATTKAVKFSTKQQGPADAQAMSQAVSKPAQGYPTVAAPILRACRMIKSGQVSEESKY